jgi:hypothetical protein
MQMHLKALKTPVFKAFKRKKAALIFEKFGR